RPPARRPGRRRRPRSGRRGRGSAGTACRCPRRPAAPPPRAARRRRPRRRPCGPPRPAAPGCGGRRPAGAGGGRRGGAWRSWAAPPIDARRDRSLKRRVPPYHNRRPPPHRTREPPMRISTTVGLQLHGPQTLDDVVDEVRHAAALGLHGAWWSQTFGWDALTAIAVTGRAVGDLAVLGTAVVPTYPRHVLALAGQALTTQAAVGGRLVLGVGPSHAPVVEGALGLAYDRPARHTREYLSALVPLLAGSPVAVRGELVRATGTTPVPGAAPPRSEEHTSE